MKYHFIGIKGSGMSALAQIMYELGNEVQGSDVTHHLFTEDLLRKKNIKILPFDEKNITKDMTVVIGNAFNSSNVEVKKAIDLDVKRYNYYDLLHDLVNKFKSVAICGCHGKTTTTALIGHVFDNIVGANYLIGDGTGHAHIDNEYFFLEACEFKRHFLNYYPKHIIMTNIELDHVDYYKDLDDMKSAYEAFLKQCSSHVIACGDDENIRSLKTDKKLIYYGFDEKNEWIAKNINLNEKGSSFDVYHENELIGHFDLPLYGKHMILNALSVIVFSYLEGLDINSVKDSIKSFKGARRRFTENKIGNVELATAAFGQGNSTTPIQIVNAGSAAINGGILHKPYILMKICDEEKVVFENKPTVIRRVISEETSKIVASSLESVVAKGTGRTAYIPNARVGGKTGTAQIAKNGVYLDNEFILSYLGFAPMDDPEVAVYISIENAKNAIQYGGTTVGPMVKEVMSDAINFLNIGKRENEIPYEPRLWIDLN